MGGSGSPRGPCGVTSGWRRPHCVHSPLCVAAGGLGRQPPVHRPRVPPLILSQFGPRRVLAPRDWVLLTGSQGLRSGWPSGCVLTQARPWKDPLPGPLVVGRIPLRVAAGPRPCFPAGCPQGAASPSKRHRVPSSSGGLPSHVSSPASSSLARGQISRVVCSVRSTRFLP